MAIDQVRIVLLVLTVGWKEGTLLESSFNPVGISNIQPACSV